MAATTAAPSKSQDVDNSAMGKFKMGRIIGDKWKIVQRLDEGGFGSVYKVENVKDPKLLAALKVEPSSSDEWNHLKLETTVLKELHARGIRAHVPALYRSAKRKSYCYMIIALLGENLLKLKFRLFPRGFPMRTWTRVGVQCLYGIKTMHDRGYVHRDIKPQNFVLGYAATPAYARVVYIIDFGLARNYAFPPADGQRKWIARRARAHLEFRGSYRYAAPTMHEEKEQGRKDDIWSWLYMLMDLYCGLPWVDTDDKNTLEKKKLHIKDEDLMTRMPGEMKFIPKHLRSLNVYQRPDYLKIYRALETLRKATKTSYEDSYEWESKEAAAANKKAMLGKQAPIGYTNAEVFFKSDPLGIKGPPTAAEEQSIVDRYVAIAPPAPPVAAAPATPKKAKPEMIVLEDILALSVKPQPKASPEKRTVDTPPTTPKSPAPATAVAASPGGPAVVRKKASRQASPNTSKMGGSAASKQSKKSKKNGTKKESMEESDDFVPSCYMNIEKPLHYHQPQNDDARDFQKKMVGLDWGHADPTKYVFKEAVSAESPPPSTAAATAPPAVLASVQPAPAGAAQLLADTPSLLLQPQLLQQQDSSGGQSDSQRPEPEKRPAVVQSPPEKKVAAATSSPSCQASCIVHEFIIPEYPTATDGKNPSEQQQPSSSSNNSSASFAVNHRAKKHS